MNYRRLFLLMGLILTLSIALLGRIFYFQAIKGAEIRAKAVAMRSQSVQLSEQIRGDILDRNLLPLTNTRTSTALFLSPVVGGVNRDSLSRMRRDGDEVQSLSETIAQLIDDMSPEQIKAAIQANPVASSFIMIKPNLTSSEVARLESAGLTGLVMAPYTRRYGDDGFCAHLLGYTDQSSNGAGQAGIEKTYDLILREDNRAPELVTVVDAIGRPIPGLVGKIQPDQSNQATVVLTIDKRVQEVVEKAMDHRAEKGAAVVMDIHSKEILAMVSRPTFDPHRIEGAISFDGRSPLTNRAVSSYYPGSVFKILLTAAALEEGLVDFESHFNCTGKYVFNQQVSISCLKEEGHGQLRFDEAFAKSCNPSFIELGLRLGRTRLLYYVDKMHLTDETVIGWGQGDMGSYVRVDGGAAAMGNASLGQQGVMVTPVQIASLLATIADDGVWTVPSLVKYTIDRDGKQVFMASGQPEQVIRPDTAVKVQELLEKVVEEGTGRTAAIPEVQVAGKTATSQTGRTLYDDKEALNTWFAGYLPAQEPRWAIVVMVEEGSSGAQNCAPIFRDISRGILKYF